MKNALCLLFSLLFISGQSLAQDTFKLNERLMEKGSYCFVQQAAIDVANGGNIEAATAILQAHINDGACVVMHAVIVYSRRIYQYENIRVYEGRVGGITIFNPTLNVAEGEENP
ncbi:MAG: hypothetical protein G01um101491_247 [Parcubacteria group bacterium Gr01-1014_91]|nr:MAG: hypothetical protein G01um101491_247 [Parcubacteria group bacterium Gr01-1014_91]